MPEQNDTWFDHDEIRVTFNEDDAPTLVLPTGQEVILRTFVKLDENNWREQISLEREISTDEAAWWTLWNDQEGVEVVIQPEVSEGGAEPDE